MSHLPIPSRSRDGEGGPKQSRNSNLKCSKHVLNFGHLELEFVSSFDIRISDFKGSFSRNKAISEIYKLFMGRNTSGGFKFF